MATGVVVLRLEPLAPCAPHLPMRRSGAVLQLAVSAALHVIALMIALVLTPSKADVDAHRREALAAQQASDVRHVVFLAPEVPRPAGGGGGGGGNQQPGPIRRARGVGADAITLRVREPAPAAAPVTTATRLADPPPLPSIVLDATPLASGVLNQLGLPVGGVPSGTSLGSGAGGGSAPVSGRASDPDAARASVRDPAGNRRRRLPAGRGRHDAPPDPGSEGAVHERRDPGQDSRQRRARTRRRLRRQPFTNPCRPVAGSWRTRRTGGCRGGAVAIRAGASCRRAGRGAGDGDPGFLDSLKTASYETRVFSSAIIVRTLPASGTPAPTRAAAPTPRSLPSDRSCRRASRCPR